MFWPLIRNVKKLLLQLNMAGYPLVLPDMIGGNGYSDDGIIASETSNRPNKEIFLRWLQANTFMPSLQFSYVPWDYDADVSEAFHGPAFYRTISKIN